MNLYQLPWLDHVRFLILDMDGTLYQDLEFHHELCRVALEETPFCGYADASSALVDSVLAGDPRIPMPDFVDMAGLDGTIRSHQSRAAHEPCVGHTGLAPLLARAPRHELEEFTLAEVAGNNLISLADAWSVSFAVIRLFDLPVEARRETFYRVRSWMLTRLAPHAPLNGALGASRLYKILQTNSPLDTGLEFIHALLDPESFHEIHCDAEKPRGLHALITRLLNDGVHPEEILSVGDHPWNDLKPARDLGCRTALISPYAGMPHGPWDLRLTTLDELAQLVQAAGRGRRSPAHATQESLHE